MNKYPLMKQVLILFFSFLTFSLLSQTFVEKTEFVFPSVSKGTVEWGDYDNDNDLDILLTGDSSGVGISHIFRNEGISGFNPQYQIDLIGVKDGATAWGDYDNDGDLDILLTGRNNSNINVSIIYRNNIGSFEDIDAGLPGIRSGSTSWGDFDNDGDLDILITGQYTGSEYISRIYRNDNGIFNDHLADLPGIAYSSVAWGDLDNDNDMDIILNGNGINNTNLTRIYRNDNGAFSVVYINNSSGVNNSSVDLGDYDNDGDLDILNTGFCTYFTTQLLRNTNGSFDDIYTSLQDVESGSAAWGDYDNDGDLDVLITGATGYSPNTNPIAKIYKNNGGNSFTEQTDISLTPVYNSSAIWGDYDNDGDLDILLTGENDIGEFTKIYENTASVTNTIPVAPTDLTATINGNEITLTWNKSTDSQTPQDGLSYNLYIGTSPSTVNIKTPMSSLLDGFRKIVDKGRSKNNSWSVKQFPAGTYYWSVQTIDNSFAGSLFSDEESFIIPFSNIIFPVSVQNLTVNQVGINLIVTESTEADSRQWKYALNSGGPYDTIITSATGTSYKPVFQEPGTYYVVCESVINGIIYTSYEVKINVTYYVHQTGINLIGVKYPSVVWGDYDKDDDLDILLTGYSTSYQCKSIIYRNDGGTFIDINASFPGIQDGSVSWGDYDNDGDLDILFTGGDDNYPSNVFSRIYRNTSGTFSDINAELPAVELSSSAWGDYDNDGDLDILITGKSSSGNISKIFRNDKNGIFTDIDAGLTGVSNGSSVWGDYDNDGDLDIFLCGLVGSNPSSKIYRNDSTAFIEINASLPGVYYSSASWGDYDSDGDLDILFSGRSSGYNITKIFRNDNGNFIDIYAGLQNVFRGSAEWGDCDNDGDLDILITGRLDGFGTSQNFSPVSIIYCNDNGVFNKICSGLTAVSSSMAAWGDYDNNGTLDILLTGESYSGYTSEIYKNNCTTKNDAPAAPLNLTCEISKNDAKLKWNSVKTDNTPSKSMTYNVRVGKISGASDIMSAHSSSAGYRLLPAIGNVQLDTTFLLKNLKWDTIYYASVQAVDNSFEGGAFSNEIQFNVTAVQASELNSVYTSLSSLLLRWKRGTGDRCILFAKEATTGFASPQNFTTYYANPAFGEGSPIGSIGWYCIYKGVTDSVLMTGLNPKKDYVIHVIEFQGTIGSEIYCTQVNSDNIGVFSTGQFTEQTNISLIPLNYSSLAYGDYDNDGDLDILITGFNNSNKGESIVYQNDNGTFNDIDAGLTDLYQGSAVWVDFDNDGDLDIHITGENNSFIGDSKIYENESGVFTEFTADLTGVYLSSVAWGDYDNDDDLDVVLTGYLGGSEKISKIYRNDNGTFTDIDANITDVMWGSVAWGDYDNDGDLDLLLTGSMGISKIYQNDNGLFTDINAGLAGVYYSSVAWGDYDNDGDLDILISGYSGVYITKIYRNDSGVFSDINAGLTGIYLGSVAWGDYDNDGDLDILISGNSNEGYIAKVFRNDNGIFTDIDAGLVGMIRGSVEWGDYDNDGDLDILMAGDMTSYTTKIYRNNLITKTGTLEPNAAPAAPQNLVNQLLPDGVKLTWNPVKSDVTNYRTMTYNIRVGSEINESDIFPSHSDNSGFRKIPSMGNAQLDTIHLIKGLPSGRYYWQVQAVDQGYQGGSWSVVDSFEVKNVQAFYEANEVCLGFPTTFTDQSVATDGIASWNWDFKDGMTSTDQNPVHTYSASGTYNIKLVITDNGGAKDSLEKDIIVRSRPITGFTAPDVCQGIPVTATNTTDKNGLTISTWNWDFGDGGTSTDEQPSPHGYLNAGDYSIKLLAIASNGCADSVTNIVSVGAYPVAAVTANPPLTFCKGDSVILSVPYNSNYDYNWMDGGTSLTGGDTSKYVARLSGNYNVEVINPVGDCRDTSSIVIVTSIDAPVAPLISADGDLEFCQGDSVVLSVINTTGYTYQWKLNGGAVGADSLRYSAKSSGTYSLTVTNSTGCAVDATNTINVTVNPSPALASVDKSGPTTFCQGLSVDLSVTNNVSYTYQWEKNGDIITGAETNSYNAQNPGVYALKISNTNGCFIKTENVTVNVLSAPSAPLISSTGALEFCQGDSVILSVTNTLNYICQWKLNGIDIGIDSSRYSAKTPGTFSLTVSDSSGCSVDAANVVSVTVNPAPSLPIVNLSGPATFCEGDSVELSVTYNPDFTYQWENNSSIITGAESNSYKAVASGTYKLNISNSYGCITMTSSVDVTVKPMPYEPVITSDNYKAGECMGETPIKLNVEQEVPGYSYQWYRNGIPVPGETLSTLEDFLTEGDYSLEADLNGCTAESDVINVFFEDAPDKPSLSAQGPTVWYLTCSIRDTSLYKYRWYCNGKLIPGANNYYYIAGRKMGDYQVSIGNELGCFTRSDIVTIPTGDVGIDDVDPFEGLKIYPNPTNGIIIVEIDNEVIGDLLIKIISQDGKELYNFMLEKTSVHFSTELNISGQPKGYYLIIFDLNKYTTVRRIIID